MGPIGESVEAKFEKRQLKMTKQLLTRDLEFQVWGRQDLELSPKARNSGLWVPSPAFSFFQRREISGQRGPRVCLGSRPWRNCLPYYH